MQGPFDTSILTATPDALRPLTEAERQAERALRARSQERKARFLPDRLVLLILARFAQATWRA